MKKFKVLAIHAIVNEIEVTARTKAEAERKVKEIDLTTNLLQQAEDTDFFAVYKAFDKDEKPEYEEDCEESDCDGCPYNDEEECLLDELY